MSCPFYLSLNDKGQVDWVEYAASNRTTFAFDESTGREVSRTDAITGTVYRAYNVRGQVIGTWGATYPEFADFSSYGQKTAMYTLRTNLTLASFADFCSNLQLFDKTQWLYDEATGLLTNKLYADNKGPNYTYTPDGKLLTRTWARPMTNGLPLVTTYTYTNTTGEMVGIDYSDNTPAVSFAFNRLGQQTTVTDGTGTRNFTYNDALQLTAETNVMGVIIRQYDNMGRNSGVSLSLGGTAASSSVSYGYSDVGRFASLSSVVAGQSNAWNYSYLHNSDLISGWLSRDPIGLWGGVNIYLFALNAPSYRRDAFGLKLAFDEIVGEQKAEWPSWPKWPVLDLDEEREDVRVRQRERQVTAMGWVRGKRTKNVQGVWALTQYKWDDGCCLCQAWEEVRDFGYKLARPDVEFDAQRLTKTTTHEWEAAEVLSAGKSIAALAKFSLPGLAEAAGEEALLKYLKSSERFGGWAGSDVFSSFEGGWTYSDIPSTWLAHLYPLTLYKVLDKFGLPLTDKDVCDKREKTAAADRHTFFKLNKDRYEIHNEEGYLQLP